MLLTSNSILLPRPTRYGRAEALLTVTPRGNRCRSGLVARVATSPARLDTRPEPEPARQNGFEPPEASNDAGFQPITSMWAQNAAAFGELVAVEEPHAQPAISLTYRELNELILDYAAGLKAQGLQQGDRVCLFAESSSRWIVADQAVLMCGAADAVRGSSSPLDELAYIAAHSGSAALLLQDSATLAKLLPAILQRHAAAPIKFIALLWRSHPQHNGKSDEASQQQHQQLVQQLESAGIPVVEFEAALAAGAALRAAVPFQPAPCSPQSLATLVYTSGTTGHPKGVMLTHANLAYQVNNLGFFLQVEAGDTTLSLLPPWHIYQRSVSYYLFSRRAREVFTSLKHFRDDLTRYPPDHFVCVPLVLDTLYNKIMAKLNSETGIKGLVVSALLSASLKFIAAQRLLQGTDLRFATQPPSPAARVIAAATAALLAPLYALAQRLLFAKVRAALGIRKTAVSGGGSLAAHLDLFYEAAGLTVLNGWGLTETSPVLACRRPSANVRGSVGLPTPGTQLVVVDPATHAPLPDGQPGLLLAAGPGVMPGYLDDPAATRAAFIDGWLDTGDLGWRAPAGVPGSKMAGHIVLTGRAKDTLVLVSGKNVEPQPIEDSLLRSPFIKHVVLLGADKRELGALVFPDEEALAARTAQAAAAAGAPSSSAAAEAAALEQLLFREVSACNAGRPDYHPEDHIAHIAVIRAPLSVEGGTLTRTMKPRRPQISKVYAAEVEQLMRRLRG